MSLARRMVNLLRRSRVDEEIDAELRSHIELRTEDNLLQGMPLEEARRDAWIRFGNRRVIRERTLGADATLIVEDTMRDLRYALRQLRRSPGFAVTSVITLMLGIGANVVVLGVVNAVLLHPLSVSDPQNLYQVRHRAWAQGRLLTHSYPAFEDLRRRNTTFSGMAGVYGYSHAVLNWQNAVTKVAGEEVTGSYFDLLGVRPQAGRLFREEDVRGAGSAPYVVLSDALWRSAFHGDPGVAGTIVELDRHPFTVMGVAAAGFHGTERFVWPDYWIPMANEEQVEGFDYLHSRTSVTVTVLGRLRPGVTALQATEDLSTVSAELGREYPETDDGQALRLIHPGLIGDEGDVIRAFLWSVAALALLVQGAACANLASLFAARAADRSRELALRVALGSGRRRLAQQLLTEAGMVSLMGGVAGLAGAWLLLTALDRWHSPYGHVEIQVDPRLYVVGLALALGSAVLFGMIPVRHAWRSSPLEMMKGGAADVVRLRRFSLRDGLLCSQIAICTLLMTASLVSVRGMMRALHAPLGFQPQGAMLAEVDLSGAGGEKAAIDAVSSLPGVQAAGVVNRTPMTGGLRGTPVFRPGTTDFKIQNSVLAPYVFSISPGYFEAAGTRLLSGRDVTWQDSAKTPFVAVVNETFARKMWGPGAAAGQRLVVQGRLTEVVGVAEDGKYHDLQEGPQPVMYVPFAQSGAGETILVVRSPRPAKEMAAALEQLLGGLVPGEPVTVESWPDTLRGQMFPAQAATVALGVMGGLAAMLAVTGMFGMAAYDVSRRMKELGIRVALGARRAQVLTAAVGRPVALLVAGSLLGQVASFAASRLLGRIVYEADPRDPVVVAGAIGTMVLLGVVASWIPALRALRVNPSRLMREE